jgi:hypothetical protein
MKPPGNAKTSKGAMRKNSTPRTAERQREEPKRGKNEPI